MKKCFEQPDIQVRSLVADEIMLELGLGSGGFLDAYDDEGLEAIKD